jgi:hypothetical protein
MKMHDLKHFRAMFISSFCLNNWNFPSDTNGDSAMSDFDIPKEKPLSDEPFQGYPPPGDLPIIMIGVLL